MIKDPVRISKAAKIYGCSRARIYDFIERGKLPSWEMLEITVVSRSQVEELSKKNKERRERWRDTMKRSLEIKRAAA